MPDHPATLKEPSVTGSSPIAPATTETIRRAGGILRNGGLVGLPTETVYGLAADATNGRAVAGIFAAKGRPRFNPLIVHVGDQVGARALGLFSDVACALAETFWPGPLSLVVPLRKDAGLSELVTAGLDTVALRVPTHPVARAVIDAADRPLAAPSANRSGHISPTTAEHVATGLDVDLVVDGGACSVGIESTVVAVDGQTVRLLRPGAVTRTMLEAVTGPLDGTEDDPHAPRSPGQLLKHYAPRTQVRLDADHVSGDEALLAFGPSPLTGAVATEQLSRTGDLVEAASRLFAALHKLDQLGARAIAVMPIPAEGLGEAIRDRLARAAAGSGPTPPDGANPAQAKANPAQAKANPAQAKERVRE